MKTLNQILVAAVVVGSAGVARADYSVAAAGSGSYTDVGSGPTIPSAIAVNTATGPVSGSSSFTVDVTGTPAFGASLLSVGSFVFKDGGFVSAVPAYFSLGSITVGGNPTTFNPSLNTYTAPITEAGDYNVVVNWTCNSAYNPFPNYTSLFDLDVNSQVLNTVDPFNNIVASPNPGVVLTSYISAVPEPSQAIAGITLLGCGGLVFLGRRFVMKKA